MNVLSVVKRVNTSAKAMQAHAQLAVYRKSAPKNAITVVIVQAAVKRVNACARALRVHAVVAV